MIERALSSHALACTGWFPVVSITGPRQSGKSTLVRHLFPSYEYYNLDDERDFNQIDGRTMDFLLEHPHRLVIDEAQRVPDLFNAIQVASDEGGTPGQYILSGSQNFLLLKRIGQSLAGRVGVLKLLPFSYGEALCAKPDLTPDDFMLRGGYPRLYDIDIPANIYFANYVATYIERDVASYIDARSVAAFRTFVTLCALSSGNLVNITRLASDTGITRDTARSWLSLLQASYILFTLPPYHTNARKRLTKTPKLYFYDTGLLCHLLGIGSDVGLRDSPYRGAVFENLIVAETLKRHVNAGAEPSLFFYRDDSKVEVDLIDLTAPGKPEFIEIKSAQTYKSQFVRNLHTVGDALGLPLERMGVVTRAQESIVVAGVKVWSAREWLMR